MWYAKEEFAKLLGEQGGYGVDDKNAGESDEK